jgi:C4-dicarboxylate transporter, DctQ subunit
MLAGLLIALATATYVAEIVARYFFRAPLNFSSDFGVYALCLSVFLALPAVTMERRHIAIAFIMQMLPPRARPHYNLVLLAVAAVVLVVVGYFVAMEAVRQFNQNTLTSMALQIPRWWLTTVACYGLLSAAIHFVTPPHRESAEIGE